MMRSSAALLALRFVACYTNDKIDDNAACPLKRGPLISEMIGEDTASRRTIYSDTHMPW